MTIAAASGVSIQSKYFSRHVEIVLLSLLALLSKVVASFEDRSLSAVLNGGLGPLKIERGCTQSLSMTLQYAYQRRPRSTAERCAMQECWECVVGRLIDGQASGVRFLGPGPGWLASHRQPSCDLLEAREHPMPYLNFNG